MESIAEETGVKKRVKKEKKPEVKKPFWRELLEYVIMIASVVVITLLFTRFIAVRSVVDGNSMNPLLHDQDNLIVEKVSYYFHDPERFDIIVFKLKNENTHYIKRIIGLPGETVQVIDGYVYVNGEKLEDDIYGNEVMENAYRAKDPIVLGENEYFVLGDNRNHSNDSRSIGPVSRSQFLGKAWVRFWPLNAITSLNDK